MDQRPGDDSNHSSARTSSSGGSSKQRRRKSKLKKKEQKLKTEKQVAEADISRRGRAKRPSLVEKKGRRSRSRSRKKVSFNDNNAFTPDAHLSLVEEMLTGKHAIQIENRRYHLRKYQECFIGSDFVDWLYQNRHISRKEASELGSKMIEEGIFHHVAGRSSFDDGFFFYRFSEATLDHLPARVKKKQDLEKLAKDIINSHLEDEYPLVIKDRKYHLRTYRSCFIGDEFVSWLVRRRAKTREQAVKIGNEMMEQGVLRHVVDRATFDDGFYFYSFCFDNRTRAKSPSPRNPKFKTYSSNADSRHRSKSTKPRARSRSQTIGDVNEAPKVAMNEKRRSLQNIRSKGEYNNAPDRPVVEKRRSLQYIRSKREHKGLDEIDFKKQTTNWTREDVNIWLRSDPVGCGAVVSAFKKCAKKGFAIDGDVLLLLTDEMLLKDCGLKNSALRAKLLVKLDKLKMQDLIPTVPYVKTVLEIVICGGGPTSLCCAIRMVEVLGSYVQIRILDGRFYKDESSGNWLCSKPMHRKAERVLTLRDEVVKHTMSEKTMEIVFSKYTERVWPHSRQITESELETQLMIRLKECKNVEFISEEPSFESLDKLVETFDIIIVPNGSALTTDVRKRTELGEKLSSDGTAFLLKIYYSQPSESDNFLPQVFNSAISLSQARYHVNTCETSEAGCMIVQITPSEWSEVKCADGSEASEDSPAVLEDQIGQSASEDSQFWPQKHDTSFWHCIEDGLRLFDIPLQNVQEIIGLEVDLTYENQVVKQIRSGTWEGKMAFLIGSAAFRPHEWPGTGINSELQGCTELVGAICETWSLSSDSSEWKGLNFHKFSTAINNLRKKDHKRRDHIIFDQSSHDELDQKWQSGIGQVEDISERDIQTRMCEIYEEVGEEDQKTLPWDQSILSYEKSIPKAQAIFKTLHPATLAMMIHSGHWPTRDTWSTLQPTKMSNALTKTLAELQIRDVSDHDLYVAAETETWSVDDEHDAFENESDSYLPSISES